MGYVARMINYFFASPKIGRSKYDEKFIDGLIQNLHLDFYRDNSTPSTHIPIEESSFPRIIYSFGGRGCKLLKRTKKQKRGSSRRGRRRSSRRGSRRGRRRSRKN